MSGSDLPEPTSPGSLVRSFMVTGGRTTSAASVNVSLETIVDRADGSAARASALQFESRNVYDYLEKGYSVAEISAHFKLPMLATLVLVSDMVEQGVLATSDTVEVSDTGMLLRIRQRIAAI